MLKILVLPVVLALGGALAGPGLAGQAMPVPLAKPAPPAAQPSATEVNESMQVQICVPDIKVLASKLQASYEEVPVSAGIGQDGNLVSVFASPNTGSWTIVMTRPQGPSCVVAVGEAWEMKAPDGPPV
jgi:hypothetical protein